jgi:hypothetical protein
MPLAAVKPAPAAYPKSGLTRANLGTGFSAL